MKKTGLKLSGLCLAVYLFAACSNNNGAGSASKVSAGTSGSSADSTGSAGNTGNTPMTGTGADTTTIRSMDSSASRPGSKDSLRR